MGYDPWLQGILKGLRGENVSGVPAFKDWLPIVTPAWTWTWKHLVLIREHLEAQERGDIENLLVMCPPQHGKSELCSIRYPIWRLARNPGLRVILGAYNSDYATRLSRKARRVAIECLDMAQDRKAVGEWETRQGGVFKSVGVGGGVTGHPGDLGIIDDPVKSRDEAESIVYRDRTHEWYTDEFSTRIQPGGVKTMVYTQWHWDDLGCRILSSKEAPRWTVLKLPALAEENDPLGRELGEALCPERFGVEELESRRAIMGNYSFSALYQCNPSPREGAFFKVGVLADNIRDTAPRMVKTCRAWDLSDNAGTGDYTAGVKLGLDENNRVWILHVVRGRWLSDERDAEMLKTARIDGTLVRVHLAIDPGQAGKGQARDLSRKLAGFPIKVSHIPKSKKEVRADPFASQVNIGNVFMLRGDWNQDLLDEYQQFPNGSWDDQVDAGGDAFKEVAQGISFHMQQVSSHEPQPEFSKPSNPSIPTVAPGAFAVGPGGGFIARP